MRYFKTSNASRRYVAGVLAFSFEPVENIGGTWLGVLAVEDDSAANTLAEAKHPQVSEIEADEFEALKKKPLTPISYSRELRAPPSNQPPPAAVPVPAAPTSSSDPSTVPDAELKIAKIDVPDELKLEAGDKRGARKK